MDKINEHFQLLLNEQKFPMKVIEEDECYIYKGRLEVSEGHLVDFAVFLSKNNDSSVAQIVFNNIAYVNQDDRRSVWLECINQLNVSHGLYYYFALDVDNRIFARYVSKVTHDVEELIYILKKGGSIIRQAMHYISETMYDDSETNN